MTSKSSGASLRASWRQLRPFAVGGRRSFAILAASSAVGGILEATVLVLITRLAVGLASTDTSIPLPLLGRLGRGQVVALAIAVVGVKLLFQLTAAYQGAALATRSLTAARLSLLDDFLAASWAEQSSRPMGELQQLMTTHVDRVATILLVSGSGLVAAANLVALLVAALAVSPVAAAGIVVTGAILAVLMRPLSAAVRRHSRVHVATGRRYAGSVTEMVAMAREIRVLNSRKAVIGRMGAFHHESAVPYQRSRFLVTFAPNLYQSLALAAVLGALSLAGGGGADVAAVGAVVLLLLRALSFSQQVQSAYHQLNELIPYLAELDEQGRRYRAAAVQAGGATLDRLGGFAFDHVQYRYDPARPALDDLSFAVSEGEAVGVVGPSGSGKSTILQLILRLREPQGGRLLVDGRDLSTFSLHSWYERVGYVPQEPHLFAGTVADNIDFFRGRPRDAIDAAAAAGNVADEIDALPEGFDTVLGDGGAGLSGGQRQRICIARALLGQPQLVVLDEPTSALDLRSEAMITETLRQLHGRTTLVIVAHRVSTLAHCDRILVVAEGRRQAFGTHDELLADSAFYREITHLTDGRSER